MDSNQLAIETSKVMAKLKTFDLSQYIDFSLTPPAPFRGPGPIRLIVLGQDPTVQKPDYREKIKITLLLNQPGGLRTYLNKVCQGLGIDLEENIYATNLLKNFFTTPPDTMRKKDPTFFQNAANYWIPLLKQEISEFENVPILPLGEPVLNSLTKNPARAQIRHYWGYEGPAQYGQNFSFIPPSENILSRIIFPFPHIPGLAHKFYRQQMHGYLAFMKKYID